MTTASERAVQVTAPLAAALLWQHIATHPTIPSQGLRMRMPEPGLPNIHLTIAPEHLGEWLLSGIELVKQSVTEAAHELNAGHVRVTAECRLLTDVGYIRFELFWLERKNLRVVSP